MDWKNFGNVKVLISEKLRKQVLDVRAVLEILANKGFILEKRTIHDGISVAHHRQVSNVFREELSINACRDW